MITAPGNVAPGLGLGRPLRNFGAPANGSAEIDTITIGGTPTGGTFTLVYDGVTTAPITWSSTNATLVANILAGLVALGDIGSGNVTVAVGTMTAGVGTITVTYAGSLAALNVNPIMVGTNSMTGTAPTVAVATTTSGVTATFRGAPKGAFCNDETNGILYQNQGTADVPSWVKVGTET